MSDIRWWRHRFNLQGLPAHYFKYLEEQDAADRFGYFPDDPLDNRQAVQSSEKNK